MGVVRKMVQDEDDEVITREREEEMDANGGCSKGRKGITKFPGKVDEKQKQKKWHNLCYRKRLDIFGRFFQI